MVLKKQGIDMEKTIKKLVAILLSICMLMTIFTPYRIEASQTTTKQNKTEVHSLELDNYIQAVTIEYQSGEDWIKKTASTYKKDPSGNGGTITYTVYVKANESNTYTLNNV